MSGGLGSGNFGALPMAAGQAAQAINPMGQLGTVLQTAQQGGNVLKLLSQMSASRDYQKSIDPATGLPNATVLGNLLAKNPMDALFMQHEQQQAGDLQNTQTHAAQQQLGLQASRYGLFSQMLSGAAGQDLSPAEVRAKIGLAAEQYQIPSSIVAPVLENLPNTPGPALDNALITSARMFAPQSVQANDLTGSTTVGAASGGGFNISQTGAQVEPNVVYHTNALQNALTPTVLSTKNPVTGEITSSVATGNAAATGPLGGGPSGSTIPLTTTPDSMVPVPLQAPTGNGTTPPVPALGPPPPATPAQAPPANSGEGSGVAMQPIGFQKYSESEQANLKQYITFNTQLQHVQQTAATQLGLLNDAQSELRNTTTGAASGGLNIIRNVAQELGLPGAQASGNYETLGKLMAQLNVQGLPGGLGKETDYQTQLSVAGSTNPIHSRQANQNILALMQGNVQTAQLAAELAQKEGILQNPNLRSDGKTFDYQKFQSNVVEKLNPMVFTYNNMDPANQKAFVQGMSSGQKKAFMQDYKFVQKLQNSLQTTGQ